MTDLRDPSAILFTVDLGTRDIMQDGLFLNEIIPGFSVFYKSEDKLADKARKLGIKPYDFRKTGGA